MSVKSIIPAKDIIVGIQPQVSVSIVSIEKLLLMIQ